MNFQIAWHYEVRSLISFYKPLPESSWSLNRIQCDVWPPTLVKDHRHRCQKNKCQDTSFSHSLSLRRLEFCEPSFLNSLELGKMREKEETAETLIPICLNAGGGGGKGESGRKIHLVAPPPMKLVFVRGEGDKSCMYVVRVKRRWFEQYIIHY